MLSIPSIYGCKYNRTWGINIVPGYQIVFSVIVLLEPEEINTTELLFGLYMNLAIYRYTSLKVTHNSNARLMVRENCAKITEMRYKEYSGRSAHIMYESPMWALSYTLMD